MEKSGKNVALESARLLRFQKTSNGFACGAEGEEKYD